MWSIKRRRRPFLWDRIEIYFGNPSLGVPGRPGRTGARPAVLAQAFLQGHPREVGLNIEQHRHRKAVLVVEEGELAGIFTPKDMMNRVITKVGLFMLNLLQTCFVSSLLSLAAWRCMPFRPRSRARGQQIGTRRLFYHLSVILLTL